MVACLADKNTLHWVLALGRLNAVCTYKANLKNYDTQIGKWPLKEYSTNEQGSTVLFPLVSIHTVKQCQMIFYIYQYIECLTLSIKKHLNSDLKMHSDGLEFQQSKVVFNCNAWSLTSLRCGG